MAYRSYNSATKKASPSFWIDASKGNQPFNAEFYFPDAILVQLAANRVIKRDCKSDYRFLYW